LSLSRRDLLLGAVGLAGTSCSKPSRGTPPAPPPAPSPSFAPTTAAVVDGGADAGPLRGVTRILEWTFRSPSERVVIALPEAIPFAKLPVVIALHGRGEALKGPASGAMGWVRDYALRRAYERLSNPPLVDADFEGLSDPVHLAAMNQALAERRFEDLIVVCPYVPDILLEPKDQKAYGKYLIDVVLPRVWAELPARRAPESTGIDGVSLGGLVALRVGLANPEVFGAVGALQAAIQQSQAPEWAEAAKAAVAKRPGLKLRLTTSKDDPYNAPNLRASEAWTAAGIAHEYQDLPGPHDYVFNRGPGALELLFWHDRVLARDG
jgi:enterochelin esterase-like enzyme